jgi:hypothetical protein
MAAEFCVPTATEEAHLLTTCGLGNVTSTDLTVPVDCDCFVISLATYVGSLGTFMFSTGTPIWDSAGTPQPMTRAVVHSNLTGRVAEIWYLLNPTAGNLSLNLNWDDEPQNPCQLIGFYLKNIEATGTVVATDGADSLPTITLTASSAITDVSIGCLCSLNSDPAISSGTSVSDSLLLGTINCSSDMYEASAYDILTTTPTIEWTGVDDIRSAAAMAVFKGDASISYTLTADSGSFFVTGFDATLSTGKNSEPGNAWFNGTTWASPSFGNPSTWWNAVGTVSLAVDSGAFFTTGFDATLTLGNPDASLVCEDGAFYTQGFAADLTVGEVTPTEEEEKEILAGAGYPVVILNRKKRIKKKVKKAASLLIETRPQVQQLRAASKAAINKIVQAQINIEKKKRNFSETRLKKISAELEEIVKKEMINELAVKIKNSSEPDNYELELLFILMVI